MEKVAVIGAGQVGQACAFALLLRASAREIVLVDRVAERATAVATDIRYSAPLSPPGDSAAGDWDDLSGAGVVLVTAGVNEKEGGATDRDDPRGGLKVLHPNAEGYRDGVPRGRPKLPDPNAEVSRAVVPRIARVAPDATIVAVTDPPDPLADLARSLA